MLQLNADYFLKKKSSKLCLEEFVEDLLQMYKPKAFNATTVNMQYILFFIQLILADTNHPTPDKHMYLIITLSLKLI